MTRDAAVSRHDRRRYVSLRGRSEFERIYREGRRSRVRHLVVIEAAGLPGPAQVGFVVGRRVGKAVVRNRVRRRLREAAALVDLGEGNAYIVIADRGAAESRLADLVVGMGQAVEADRRPSEGGA